MPLKIRRSSSEFDIFDCAPASTVVPVNPVAVAGLHPAGRLLFPLTRQAISEVAYPTRTAVWIGGPNTNAVHELLDSEHEHDGNQQD